ncbi:MAG TPA: hypothetical protein VMU75_01840 [Acidimicrobiales bacterium]|nr:hypothetical protein [Acidimicrobiales bacterium]
MRAAEKRRWVARDTIASALVVAIIAPYIGYLARGSVPFVEDVEAMAGAGLVLGLLACAIGGRGPFGPGIFLPVALIGGLSTLGLGLAAFVTTNAGVLAAFMAAVVAMWLATTIRHVLVLTGDHRTPRIPTADSGGNGSTTGLDRGADLDVREPRTAPSPQGISKGAGAGARARVRSNGTGSVVDGARPSEATSPHRRRSESLPGRR